MPVQVVQLVQVHFLRSIQGIAHAATSTLVGVVRCASLALAVSTAAALACALAGLPWLACLFAGLALEVLFPALRWPRLALPSLACRAACLPCLINGPFKAFGPPALLLAWLAFLSA